MATSAKRGVASAAFNVVRLPTAAPRKVQNYGCREQRMAAFAECQSKKGRWHYKHPGERAREAAEAAKPSLAHIEHTPALVIALAMFGMANEDTRRAALACANLIDLVRPSAAAKDALLMMESVANLTVDADNLSERMGK